MIDAPEPKMFGGMPMLQAWCDFPPCSWKRCAEIRTARGIELAGHAHMKDFEGHTVSMNFPVRP